MRYFTLILIVLLTASAADAQWKQVFVGTGKPVYDVYFQNNGGDPQIGFFAEGGNVWRTQDAGTSWQKVADLSAAASYGIVSDFKFKDAMVGWFSCRTGISGNSGIYRTLDGGLTWTPLPTSGYMNGGEGMYYLSRRKILLVSSWQTGLNESTDDGWTWTNIVSGIQYDLTGISFSPDDKFGVVGNAADNNPKAFGLYTTDGGITWIENTLVAECWSPKHIGSSLVFYGLFEEFGRGPKISYDGGQNWIPRKSNNFSTVPSGDLEGTTCRLYCQSYTGNVTGVFRSLDTGANWEYLGGPNTDFFDRRFWAGSNRVFAGDSLGNLYYLLDTLGTAVSARLTLTATSIAFDTLDACSDSTIVLRLRNKWPCDSVQIVSAGFVNGPPIFQILPPTDLSRWIEPNGTDSILLRFPKTAIGTFDRKLRVRLKFGNFSQDTIIDVSGTRLSSSLIALSANAIDFDTIGLCTTGHRRITVINTGCDTESIVLDSSAMNAFHVEQPTSGVELRPGDSIVIVVRMDGTVLGNETGYLKLTVVPRLLASTTFTVDITGFVDKRPTTPVLSNLFLQFDSISFCDTTIKLSSVSLTNPSACDSIQIDSAWISGDTKSFTLVNMSTHLILPLDSLNVSVDFHGIVKGQHRAILHIRYFDGVAQHDTTVELSAVTYSGSGRIFSENSFLDLGETTLCASDRDTAVLLRNIGCDTLRIQDATMLGAGFTLDTTMPIVIPPGRETQLPIHAHFDSTGAATSNITTLTIVSDADNILAPITLKQSLGLPISYGFYLRPASSLSTTSGQSVRFDVVADRIKMPAVRTLDFNIALNDDLLGFASAQGPNTVTETAGHLKIVGTPYIQIRSDSVVASLIYNVYLTKDSTTSVTLSSMHLNADDSAFEKCYATASVGSGGDTVKYVYSCGEHLIQDLLRSDPIRISSIIPNPVRDNVTITVLSHQSTSAEMEVFDEKGTKLVARSLVLVSGYNSISLSTAAISSGFYKLRLKTRQGEVSSSFIKEQ